MKNILPLFMFLFLSTALYSQNRKTEKTYKNATSNYHKQQKIEAKISAFILSNSNNYKLTESKKTEIEHQFQKNKSKCKHSDIAINIENAKKNELRKLYLSKNSEDSKFFDSLENTSILTQTICEIGGFEDLISDDFQFRRRAVNVDAIECDFDTNDQMQNFIVSNDVNLDSINIHATLTDISTGTIPIYDSVLEENNVYIPVANTGRYAVKLNNEHGFAFDGNQATVMSTSFILTPADEYVSYSFNYICLDPGHEPSKQPRFIVRLLDRNNNIISQNCLVSDVNNTMMFSNAADVLMEPILYTDWQCASLTTKGLNLSPDILDRQVTLEFFVSDCTPGKDYGMVYIDDICTTSNCENPLFGSLDLNFDDNFYEKCPDFPINVCGSYVAPRSISNSPITYATLTSLQLNIIGNGSVINIPLPTTQTNNSPPQMNTFCFELQESDFPSPITGEFEFEIDAVFDANGTPFYASALSAIPGPDLSFDDCCQDHLLISETINDNQTITEQANLTITAENLLNDGAVAIYHAGNSITLIPPFTAKTGSEAHFYIEGCTGNFERSDKMVKSKVAKGTKIEKIELEKNRKETVQKVKIIPNPNNGIFDINLEETTDGIIEIADMKGSIIQKIEFKNSKEINLDIRNFEKGIYLIRLVSKQGVYIEKMIKN